MTVAGLDVTDRQIDGDNDSESEDVAASERATGRLQALREAVRQAADDGASARWCDAMERFLAEAWDLRSDQDVYLAHLLHRSLRAEVSVDGAPPEKMAVLRAPDLKVAPQGPNGAPGIPLPRDVDPVMADFSDLVQRRRSTPLFGESSLALDDLAAVLSCGLAAKGAERAYQRRDIHRRVFPSAGGLQPFDAQVIVSRVAGVAPGRYAYNPVAHTLDLLEPGDFRIPLVEATIETRWLLYAPAVIALTADFSRVAWKYGTRGYRFMTMDAGVAIGQIYLAATAASLAVNAVAAFRDDAINDLLHVDGRDRFTQILVGLGNAPGRPRR